MKLKINNTILPILIAKSFQERFIGLMGKTDIKYGMLFPKCNSVHTFFMKENIDILGLNENNEIIFIEQNCRKNKIIQIHHSLKKTSILELPKNTCSSFHLGDKINFILE